MYPSEDLPLRTLQVCTKCQVEKAAEEFNRNKVRPDGLCSYCKVCNAAAAAERRRSRAPVTEPTVSHKVPPPVRLCLVNTIQGWGSCQDQARSFRPSTALSTPELPIGEVGSCQDPWDITRLPVLLAALS